MKKKKLTDSEIVAILHSQIDNAQGSDLSSVETQQANALDYYYGDKSIIDTEDGESSIITREVLDNDGAFFLLENERGNQRNNKETDAFAQAETPNQERNTGLSR